mgnify:CR=1 FL=1
MKTTNVVGLSGTVEKVFDASTSDFLLKPHDNPNHLDHFHIMVVGEEATETAKKMKKNDNVLVVGSLGGAKFPRVNYPIPLIIALKIEIE